MHLGRSLRVGLLLAGLTLVASMAWAAPADEIDDDEVSASAATSEPGVVQLPADLARLTATDIRRLLKSRPVALGPLSVGWTNSGSLVNAVQMPPGDRYTVMDPAVAWATQETIDYLRRAIDQVHREFPNTQRLPIGHLSRKSGGHLASHKSHQSGRDVDADYYHRTSRPGFYRNATAASLDRRRTWAFIRALITETDVQMIFIDTPIQRMLKQHALSIGEDPEWLDRIFEYASKQPNPIIRHARGHSTHMHIRFYSPVAQEMGRRAYGALVDLGRIKPVRYFVNHRARKGDTLGRLAQRHGTTVEAIQRANKLKSTKIIAKKTYRIPKKGRVRPAPGPVRIPARRLPPPRKRRGGPAGLGATAAPAR